MGPEPEIVTLPGVLVNVQVPVAGSPLKFTLPVEIAHVGWVMAPTTGALGAEGCGLITASADANDEHPAELVTIKV